MFLVDRKVQGIFIYCGILFLLWERHFLAIFCIKINLSFLLQTIVGLAGVFIPSICFLNIPQSHAWFSFPSIFSNISPSPRREVQTLIKKKMGQLEEHTPEKGLCGSLFFSKVVAPQ